MTDKKGKDFTLPPIDVKMGDHNKVGDVGHKVTINPGPEVVPGVFSVRPLDDGTYLFTCPFELVSRTTVGSLAIFTKSPGAKSVSYRRADNGPEIVTGLTMINDPTTGEVGFRRDAVPGGHYTVMVVMDRNEKPTMHVDLR